MTTGNKQEMATETNSATQPTVTAVLTPGRSGSSLVMEILGNLGMVLSSELISGRLENPHGFFEDARVVEIHKELMTDLGARAGYPMPERWLDEQVTRQAKRALVNLVRAQVTGHSGNWAIKDPRLSELLPLWLQVFNKAGMTPRFVLAVRDPAVVATSLKRYEARDERSTELLWLLRITQALYHSAADCYVVHYEDWFDQPWKLAQSLAHYCGLQGVSEEQAQKGVEAAVESRLDRSSWQEYEVRHPLVKKLYATLRQCSGKEFDRTAVLGIVRESVDLLDGFSWWGRCPPGDVDKIRGTGPKGRNVGTGTTGADPAEEQPIKGYHKLLRQLKDREDEVVELRSRLLAAQRSVPALPRTDPRAASDAGSGNLKGMSAIGEERKLYNSVRYRLGDIIVRAVTRPGRNTVAAPVRLIRLFSEALRKRRVRTQGT